METILDSSTEETESSQSMQIKAASAPIVPIPKPEEGEKLKTQISAPSYLFSLKENDAPPFRKPCKEARPEILVGTIMSENEAVAMIAFSDGDKNNGLRQFLGYFLVEKAIIMNYNLSEKNFLVSLLLETIDYAAQRDFSAFKLACLVTIYLSTHLYFKWYYWQSPSAVWFYFKELMVRHTIEDSPDGEEVFEPEECYDIVSHFHTVYLNNLPLIHILTFGAYRLKFSWPFKPK
ncbi:hypothetical protein K1T71_002284 [Dendrolimus kikuchii]|uniref:Uncharacterized protein n=1 Tax=Dendrolimus kikuchii TaxID=765133 RepID=A0ACC1DCF6_9NEOP|nr:hypothetical protein K1T71_002284 [Dendrolimus kikuchii]